jgi:hypothetical protein
MVISAVDHIIHYSIENVLPSQQISGLTTKTDPLEEEEIL